MQIVCPHCQVINRLPDNKPAQQANCGQCKQALFCGEPLNLNQAQFERHLHQGELPLVVDFWAAWCGPCKMMAPVFHQAAGRIEPRARLLKVDTEAEQALAAQYAIRSIPTLVIFSAGQEIARVSGALDLTRLQAWINQHVR